MPYIPSATYRIQLTPEFTLKDLKERIPYLHALGIDTIYAAPFFKARTGSQHRYDVAEAHRIGPDLGTLEEFDAITQQLRELGMGWLQDIVPNHMVFHPENIWLMDVLEKGQRSEYAELFDIDWKHPEIPGKLMVPFLGDPLDEVLKKHQIGIAFNEHGLQLDYFDSHYPASVPVYQKILQQVAASIGNGPMQDELNIRAGVLEEAASDPVIDEDRWERARSELYRAVKQTAALEQIFKRELDRINNDRHALQEILGLQHYVLCHWKETEKRINYRRFFTINELICLNMRSERVFDRYHRFIKVLCEQHMVQGLRVDHIDGLYDPNTYLERLRALAGPDAYVVVEKILEGHEALPDDWPAQGNSGYDFLAWIGNLYTDREGELQLTRLYEKLVPQAPIDYEKLVFEKKMFILQDQMAGELENLLRVLEDRDLLPPGSARDRYREPLAILLASFPVYRIYVRQLPLNEPADRIVSEAFDRAMQRTPHLNEQFDHLRSIFQSTGDGSDEVENNKLYFVMRSQQFTGPLAAKGVEDTAFYNYNRLLALNEVGNNPEVFHLRRPHFHELMQHKLKTYPHSINATATHDTKRGEGMRMRLQVLSEMPEEWADQVHRWTGIIRKRTPAGKPTANDLYFMLQTLIGVVPIDGTIDGSLVERVQEYLIKAFREAKENTNWSRPDEDYESVVKDLTQELLRPGNEFVEAFLPFQRKLAHYGWLYSLCQTMLKLTCPGVPDIYQGCELWDLSLVDPDNRRPVDYDLREKLLHQLQDRQRHDVAKLHRELLSSPEDGKVKLYLIQKVLNERRPLRSLFDHGDYTPLYFNGRFNDNLIGFTRRHGDRWCMVIVPRLLTQVIAPHELPLGDEIWGDTMLQLQPGSPGTWTDIFTGTDLDLRPGGQLPIGSVLNSFPVALLTSHQ